jgi:hypothetical protein
MLRKVFAKKTFVYVFLFKTEIFTIFFVIHKNSLELKHVHISKNIRFLKVKKQIRKEEHKTKNRSNRSNKKTKKIREKSR